MLTKLKSGMALIVLSAITYSFITILLGKISSTFDWSAFQVLFFRFFVAGIICCALFYKDFSKFDKRKILSLTLLSIFYLLTSIFFYFDISKSGASSATATLFSYPLFIVIIKSIEDRAISLHFIAAALLATIGCAMANNITNFDISPYSFLSPFFYSLYIWSSEKLKISGDASEIGYLFLTSSIFLLIFNFPAIQHMNVFSLGSIQLTLLICVSLLSVLSVLFFLKGVVKIGATKSSVLATTEPMFTVLLALVILKQSSTTLQILGIILIIVSNFLITKKKTTLSPQ